MLATYLQNHANRTVTMEMLAAIKTTLLQGTTHGKIFAVVDNTGRTSYHYDPTPNYEGDDRAVFLAEFEGKVYKIVIDLHVFEFVVDESASSCSAPKLIKVKKPASGSSDLGLDGVTVSFSEMSGGTLGQTTGSNITLDTTAANYGWYIDYTPYLNDEYLPTSNPNLWVAKAGTEAAGKMDLLSVLLHEYGHALGLEHSADSGDYMAATLKPGERRLPSSDELALMARLVAEAKGSYDAPIANGDPSVPTDPINPDQPGAPLPSRSNVRTTRARISRYGTTILNADGSFRYVPFHHG
jgi:hypothetical protein